MATDKAPADSAMITEENRAFRQPGSAKICRYHSSEKPVGGKASVFA